MTPDSPKLRGKSKRNAEEVQSGPLTLIVMFVGVLTCYILYGICQEALYTIESHREDGSMKFFTYTSFFLACQFAACILTSCTLIRSQNKSAAQSILDMNELSKYASCGLSYFGAMYFSNEALKYVNYPTQALAKSCKLVPVMLFDLLTNQREFSAPQSFTVMVVALGMSTFLSHDVIDQFEAFPIPGGKASIHYDTDDAGKSLYGNVLLFISLIFNGVTSSVQGHLMLGDSAGAMPTAHGLMFGVNTWAFAAVGTLALLSGEMGEGLTFCYEHHEAAMYVCGAALASAVGQLFVFYTLVHYDGTTLAAFSSVRKLITLYLSSRLFGNVLSHTEIVGIVIVFAGIFFNLLHRAWGSQETEKHDHKVD